MPNLREFSRRRLVAAAAALFAVFMLIQTPASTLGWALNRESTPLRLQGLDGSLWRGQAETAAARINERWLDLGQLRWSMVFSRLPFAELALDLKFERPQLRFTGRLGLGLGVRLDTALLELDGQLINPWLADEYGAGGNFNINARRIVWRDGLREADLNGLCFDCVLHLPETSLALGDLALDIGSNGGVLNIQAQNAPGEKNFNPLELIAALNYDGSEVDFDMRAKPSKQASADLRRRLRDLAGKPDGEGYFNVNWRREINHPLLRRLLPNTAAPPQSQTGPDSE